MNIGKENFIPELGNIFVTAAALIILGGVSSPAAAQRRDDAVTSGASRGGGKVVISTPAKGGHTPDFEAANFLLKEEVMGSTSKFYQSDIAFGEFTNKSNYPLMIAINHKGSQADRYSRLFLHGYIVAYNPESTSFVVHPGGKYKWVVKDTHSITAWVMTSEIMHADVGLPLPENFQKPVFIPGNYRGCLADRSGVTEQNIYYYEAKGAKMTDGSSAWNQHYGYVPEFNEFLAAGSQPAYPGQCVVRYPVPPAQDGGNGGA